MRKLVCPVSKERIPEHIVRISAFTVGCLYILYIVTGFFPLAVILLMDFILRAMNLSAFSPVSQLAYKVSNKFQVKSISIDKAPKMFAARLGSLLAVLLIVFHVFDLNILVMVIASTISVFAFLECFFNFCVGCYIYNFFVWPFYKNE